MLALLLHFPKQARVITAISMYLEMRRMRGWRSLRAAVTDIKGLFICVAFFCVWDGGQTSAFLRWRRLRVSERQVLVCPLAGL